MFINNPAFVKLTTMKTSEPTAWERGYYETYRLTVAIPAVRVHPRNTPRNIVRTNDGQLIGVWFGVDRYHDRVATYKRKMALINLAEEADSYVLQPGGVFNVGTAAPQKLLSGGAWQFEYVSEQWPQHQPLHNEHMAKVSGHTRIPL